MDFIKYMYILFFVFCTFCMMSCDKKINGVYIIEVVSKTENDENFVKCFKSKILEIDESKNLISLPGYINFTINGRVDIYEDSIFLTNMEEEYFEKKYSYRIEFDNNVRYLIMENKDLFMRSRMIDFEYSFFDSGFFENLVDKEMLESQLCQDFRKDIN